MSSPLVTVISSLRPGNVPKMAAWGVPLRWYVPLSEAGEYRAAGADDVVGVRVRDDGTGQELQRNRAMTDAFAEGRACVQLDDDLKRLQRTTDGKKLEPCTLAEAIDMLVAARVETGALLAGPMNTANLFYRRVPIQTRVFICSQFWLIAPNPLRVDEEFRLRADYDYCLQHMARYGMVCRVDDLMPTFDHYNNSGGVVRYRTPATVEASIRRLESKWGRLIQRNPRRPGEILLKLPRQKATT